MREIPPITSRSAAAETTETAEAAAEAAEHAAAFPEVRDGVADEHELDVLAFLLGLLLLLGDALDEVLAEGGRGDLRISGILVSAGHGLVQLGVAGIRGCACGEDGERGRRDERGKNAFHSDSIPVGCLVERLKMVWYCKLFFCKYSPSDVEINPVRPFFSCFVRDFLKQFLFLRNGDDAGCLTLKKRNLYLLNVKLT